MKRTLLLALFVGIFVIALTACSSDPKPTATPQPTSTPVPVATIEGDASSIVPDDAVIDRKTAMLIGINLHRELWATRPSSNYKFGFQWNEGEFAYERANVEVRVLKNIVDSVRWADNAVKTDGTEPVDFVVPAEPNMDQYYEIDGLFKIIEQAINDGPGSVTLGFDSVFGFPTNVVIEFAPGSEHKNISFFAAELVPIPGPPE
ncbi:MAG: hypothetical protein HQ477_13055 [Chloroflexi bacterium]|nr:hypothetical protein [Chloroflexota bacterium]